MSLYYVNPFREEHLVNLNYMPTKHFQWQISIELSVLAIEEKFKGCNFH